MKDSPFLESAAPGKTEAAAEDDFDSFPDIPEIFRKDSSPHTPSAQKKGNLPALILGAAGLIFLIWGLWRCFH